MDPGRDLEAAGVGASAQDDGDAIELAASGAAGGAAGGMPAPPGELVRHGSDATVELTTREKQKRVVGTMLWLFSGPLVGVLALVTPPWQGTSSFLLLYELPLIGALIGLTVLRLLNHASGGLAALHRGFYWNAVIPALVLPLAVYLLLPSMERSEYRYWMLLAAWGVVAVVLVPALALSFRVSGAREDLSVGDVLRMVLVFSVLAAQLTFSFTFAWVFSLQPTAELASMYCVVYPAVIGVFKAAAVTVADKYGSLDVTVLLRLFSFSFASLPYRLLFLIVSSWSSLALVIAIEGTYKLVAISIKLSRTWHQTKHVIKRQVTVSSIMSFSLDDELTKSAKEVCFLTLIDMGNAALCIVVFAVVRLEGVLSDSPIGSMPVDSFVQLISYYLVGIAITALVFVIVLMMFKRRKAEIDPLNVAAHLFDEFRPTLALTMTTVSVTAFHVLFIPPF